MKKLFSIIALLCSAFAFAQSGPVKTYSFNDTLYVGQVAGFYPTIQSAMTAACSGKAFRVVVSASATGAGDLAAATGCTTVNSFDERTAPTHAYIWSGSANVCQNCYTAVNRAGDTGMTGPLASNYGNGGWSFSISGAAPGQPSARTGFRSDVYSGGAAFWQNTLSEYNEPLHNSYRWAIHPLLGYYSGVGAVNYMGGSGLYLEFGGFQYGQPYNTPFYVSNFAPNYSLFINDDGSLRNLTGTICTTTNGFCSGSATTTTTTQAFGDNSTKLASTAFVAQALGGAGTSVALPTASIAAGTCSGVIGIGYPNASATSVFVLTPQVDESTVTGYGAQGLRIISFYGFSGGTSLVYTKVCNTTAAAITPGAMTVNIRALF